MMYPWMHEELEPKGIQEFRDTRTVPADEEMKVLVAKVIENEKRRKIKERSLNGRWKTKSKGASA